MKKIQAKFHLCSQVKYGLHCASLHEIQAYSEEVRSPTLNFTQNGQEIEGEVVKINLSP
jgi:hypothetical protein